MNTTEPFTAQEIIDAVPRLSQTASLELSNHIFQMRLAAIKKAQDETTPPEPTED